MTIGDGGRAPIESHDAVQAEVLRRAGPRRSGAPPGPPHGRRLPGRRARASREACERCDQELVGPVVAELFTGQAPSGIPPRTEFEVRGLVLPTGGPA
jgi:hypothetical protein